MKFIILKENLKKGLMMTANLSSRNINLPILNNILIKARKNGIELSATNLEININHFIRAKVEKEGDFTVDAKLITEYINLLPDDKIEIELVDESLNIKCQNYKTKIRGQSSSDFPLLNKIEERENFSIDLNTFKNALTNVVFSVSSNDNRLELTGIFFKTENGFLNLVGTDSYRLAEKKIKYKEEKPCEQNSVIIPARTIQELIRLLNNFKIEEQLEGENEVKVYLSENQIFFSFGSTNISSRIINGSYPDYQQIIPEKEKTILNVNKNTLVRAVKAAGLFSKTGINDIILLVKKNKIQIISSSNQYGENIINLEGSVQGEDNEITINYRYLLEGLNNINSDNIIIKIIDNNTPCVVLSEKKDNFLYLIMPLRN